MSEAREAAAVPHVRLSEALDRCLPLIWLGVYLLLPTGGNSKLALTTWFDQARDLEALRSVLDHGSAEAIDDNVIGPAYIALAALIHLVTGLSPEDSLVGLTRASYALSVVAGLVLIRVLVQRLAAPPPVVSLGAQLVFLAVVFSARTWEWSDIPWSHFLAAFLCLAFYALRLLPARLALVAWAGIGVVLALLALTRTFEFLPVVAAWVLAIGLLAALRIRPLVLPDARAAIVGAGSFLATAVAVHLATGKSDLFVYASGVGRHWGDVPPEDVADTPALSIGLLPIKAVQLVLDPCYYALCSETNYSGDLSQWRMPLAIQLPALVLLPLCVLAVGVLLAWSARHRTRAAARAAEIGLLTEMAIAASGLALGYLASTTLGSSHLKNGVAREFFVPALLSGVVAVTLAAAGIWVLLTQRRRAGSAVSPGGAALVAAMATASVIVGMVFVAREVGLPRFESRHLGGVEYSADCGPASCAIGIAATTTAGKPISIPRASTLTFGCGDATRYTIYVRDPTDGVAVDRTCSSPRLVAAWPTVMGLPPGSSELRAVSVANAATE